MKIIATNTLSLSEINGLKYLFDKEYLEDFGPWTLADPYGYSSLENHVLALDRECIVGYAGSQKRLISVGNENVVIAGIGGVLVDKNYRGVGIASKIMEVLINYNKTSLGADFSYLGCRDEVLPFYLSCGFQQLKRLETRINSEGQLVTEVCSNILVADGLKKVDEFPQGEIKLNGRAW